MGNIIKIISSMLITISILYVWKTTYYISSFSIIILVLASYTTYIFNVNRDISYRLHNIGYIYNRNTLLYKLFTSKILLSLKNSIYSIFTISISFYILLTMENMEKNIIFISTIITIILFLFIKYIFSNVLVTKNINYNLVRLVILLSTVIFSYILFKISINKEIPELYFKNIDKITEFYKSVVYSQSIYNDYILSYLNAIDTIIWHYSLLIMSKFENRNIDSVLLIWLTIKNLFVLFTINKFAISTFLYFYTIEDKKNVL